MSSVVTQLKERLRLEAEAAFQGLYGYAQVAAHQIIRQKMRRVDETFKQLEQYIGEEEAELLLVNAMEQAHQKVWKNEYL